jgi:hypothetical protein
MNQDEISNGFYVAIAAEVDEEDLVADIVFAGQQVADVRRLDQVWTVTLYTESGADEIRLPLDGFLAALRQAAERLTSG